MGYGATRDEALARVKALALRVMADRLEHGEGRSAGWEHMPDAKGVTHTSPGRSPGLIAKNEPER